MSEVQGGGAFSPPAAQAGFPQAAFILEARLALFLSGIPLLGPASEPLPRQGHQSPALQEFHPI